MRISATIFGLMTGNEIIYIFNIQTNSKLYSNIHSVGQWWDKFMDICLPAMYQVV